MRNGKVLVVFSGGMDSTVALYQAVKEYGAENVLAVSFNYQSKHNDSEFEKGSITTKKLGVEHRRVDLSGISEHLDSNLLKKGGDIPEGHYAESNMKKTVVPFRNGIMLAVACGIAESIGAGEVILGNHAGDHHIYEDCRATFISAMNEAMAYGTSTNVNIKSPFCNKDKKYIASVGAYLGVPFEDTYSCYNGREVQCGVCSTCFERREAFVEAGISDPTVYEDKRSYDEIKKEYDARLAKEK